MLGESAFLGATDSEPRPGLDQVLSQEPSPEFVAQLTDEFKRLFGKIEDPDLRTVATMRMEGYTIDEMSTRLGRAPATIERKLKVIRTLWESSL